MRHRAIRVCLRSAGWTLLLAISAVRANAQDQDTLPPQLTFTIGVSDRATSTPDLHLSIAIEERGLAMWSGRASDFGMAVALSHSRWTLRSVAGMTTLPFEGQRRPNIWQAEAIRQLHATRALSIAGGGGIREEWDGTQTLIGRVLAGSDLASGRLQGSLVIERVVSSPRSRDAADVITTLGWSRPLTDRVSVGVESIGQDLEGLWDPAEADGGARLLVGPSIHARSSHSAWTTSFTAGPVVQKQSRLAPSGSAAASSLTGGHQFGIFASATWVPSLRR